MDGGEVVGVATEEAAEADGKGNGVWEVVGQSLHLIHWVGGFRSNAH